MLRKIFDGQSPKRIFRGSGQMNSSNSVAILSGETIFITLDERFTPYDFMIIQNLNLINDVTIKVNQRHTTPLPSGNEVQVQIQNIRSVFITNNGNATISVDELQIQYQNSGYQGKKMIDQASSVLGAFGNIRLIGGLKR